MKKKKKKESRDKKQLNKHNYHKQKIELFTLTLWRME